MADSGDTGPNTEMFRAFVERGERDRAEERRTNSTRITIALALVLAVVIVVAWLIAR
jgi:flagellar biogenesis protein FliO